MIPNRNNIQCLRHQQVRSLHFSPFMECKLLYGIQTVTTIPQSPPLSVKSTTISKRSKYLCWKIYLKQVAHGCSWLSKGTCTVVRLKRHVRSLKRKRSSIDLWCMCVKERHRRNCHLCHQQGWTLILHDPRVLQYQFTFCSDWFTGIWQPPCDFNSYTFLL